MVHITYKQYLILKKLYESKPDSIQLEVNNDLVFLFDSKLIDSELDLLGIDPNLVSDLKAWPNGNAKITNLGESTFNSYFDTCISRIGVIISLIISIAALLVSILKP